MSGSKSIIEGRTFIYAEECSFVWKIENFSVCLHHPSTKIRSPMFTTGSMFQNAWSLELYPSGYRGENIGLFLIQNTSDKSNYYALCTLSLLNNWGQNDFIYRFHHLYNDHHRCLGTEHFVQKSIFDRYKFNLMKDDTLTLVCDLKICRPDDDMYLAVESSSVQPMITTPAHRTDSLSNDLLKLYESKLHSDLVLKAGDEILPVHKAILCARSSVFTTMLQYEMKEKITSCIEISDFDPEIVKILVSYLYSGNLHITDSEIVVQLYHASVKYALQDLKELCLKIITSNLSLETVVDTLRLGDLYQDEQLKLSGENFFQTNASKVIESVKWMSLCDEKPALASHLLKNIILRQKRTVTKYSKSHPALKKRKI